MKLRIAYPVIIFSASCASVLLLYSNLNRMTLSMIFSVNVKVFAKTAANLIIKSWTVMDYNGNIDSKLTSLLKSIFDKKAYFIQLQVMQL